MLRVVLTVCCVALQGHATQPSCFQSLAPATQKSSINPKVLRLPRKCQRHLRTLCSHTAAKTHDFHPLLHCLVRLTGLTNLKACSYFTGLTVSGLLHVNEVKHAW